MRTARENVTHDLWQVGACPELKCPKVIKYYSAIISTEHDNARIVQEGDVIATTWWELSTRSFAFPLQRDWPVRFCSIFRATDQD